MALPPEDGVTLQAVFPALPPSDTPDVVWPGEKDGGVWFGSCRGRRGGGGCLSAAEGYKSAGFSRTQSFRQASLWGTWGGRAGAGDRDQAGRGDSQGQPSGLFHGAEKWEVSGSCQTLGVSALSEALSDLIPLRVPWLTHRALDG